MYLKKFLEAISKVDALDFKFFLDWLNPLNCEEFFSPQQIAYEFLYPN